MLSYSTAISLIVKICDIYQNHFLTNDSTNNFKGTVDVIVQVADGENIQTAVVGIDGEDMNDFLRVVMGQRLIETVEQKFIKGD